MLPKLKAFNSKPKKDYDMATTTITNRELLHQDALALGYPIDQPMMSSEDALTWIVGNRTGPVSTLSNSQKIATHDFKIEELNKLGTYRGLHPTIEVADGSVDNPVDGDYILVGSRSGNHQLYTREANTWEQGYKSTIEIIPTAESLPDLGIDDKGALFFVKDESSMYLFDGTNYHAATTPTIIDGYQFNLILS